MSGIDDGGGRTDLVWMGYLLFVLSCIVVVIFGGIALYGYSTGDGDLAKLGIYVIGSGLRIVAVMMVGGVGYALATEDLGRITDDDTGILYAFLTTLSAVSVVLAGLSYFATALAAGRVVSVGVRVTPPLLLSLATGLSLLAGVFIALERTLEGLRITPDRGTDDDQHVTDRFH